MKKLAINETQLDDENSDDSHDFSQHEHDQFEVTLIEIKRNEVFRVPLMWMMPDSEVDMYIEEQDLDDEQEKLK